MSKANKGGKVHFSLQTFYLLYVAMQHQTLWTQERILKSPGVQRIPPRIRTASLCPTSPQLALLWDVCTFVSEKSLIPNPNLSDLPVFACTELEILNGLSWMGP